MNSPAGNRANAITLAITVVAGLVIFFRLFTRVAIVKKVGLEDCLILLSMALSIGLAVAIGEQVRNGLGWHSDQLTDSQLVAILKAFWASIWMYNLSLTTTKVSILIHYLRIFPTRLFRIVCSVVLGFVTAYGVWTLFGSIFLCTPVDFFWDKNVDGSCMSQFVVWFTNAGVNIAQDLMIIILPIPVLRRLSIPKAHKRALIVVYAMGGIVVIISIIRIYSLVAISDFEDPAYDNSPAATLSVIETNFAIIAACLPFLRPLLTIMMPTVFPESTSNYRNMQIRDEEQQPKYLRPLSLSTRPPTAGSSLEGSSRRSHQRTRSSISESELSDLRSPQAAVAGTRVRGSVRQVTIGSGRQTPSSLIAPTLPRVPENIAIMSPVALAGNPDRYSLKLSSPLSGRYRPKMPKTPKTPRTPGAHKPLPITPFPIMMG